jgi:uncharacterized protein YecE (DUF72 family)
VYKHWRGILYPEGLPQTRWFGRYAEEFDTVELNNSFYRLPPRETFVKWGQRTPRDFVVAVKASRYLTHMKRLLEPAEPVGRLLDHARGLGPKLGPVLVQLPPRFRADPARLAAALDEFPAGIRVAVEPRDASWFSDAVRTVLTERNAALCLADRHSRWLTPRWRTADWGYVRFHWGGGVPDPCYSPETLALRARELAEQWGPDEDVFVYFNNDPRCCAVRDAGVFADCCAALGLPHTRTPSPGDVQPVMDG